MLPADFPEIPRNQYTTDETIAYAIAQAVEYAQLHAPNAITAQDAIIRLFVAYCHQQDLGEKILLRHALDMVINRYQVGVLHAP